MESFFEPREHRGTSVKNNILVKFFTEVNIAFLDCYQSEISWKIFSPAWVIS